MDIILIQSPCWGLYAPPLGLASLTAFLRSKGLSVAAMDLNIDMFYRCKDTYKKFWEGAEMEFWHNETLVKRFFLDNYELIDAYLEQICSSDARIIGFSVYDTSLFLGLFLARKIKKNCPDKLIIFGGPHCSQYMCRDFIVSQECVDVVIEGEGEETLFQIADMVIRGNGLKFCPGALIKRGTEIIDGGERSLIDNLDSLPFPNFCDYPLGHYIRTNVIPASTSRGCVNRCIFCNEWTYWKRYRYKTGEYIFREIKHQLSSYPQIKYVEFYDSLCNGNLKELSILAEFIIKDKLKIRWVGQAIINSGMDIELLSKFRESGCWCLAYGLESGSQRVLDRMRKGFRISDAERVIRQTYATGIDVALNFMFGHPGETEDDFKETLDFISRNRKYINIVNPSPSFCGIAPGTYLYNHPEEFDIATPIDNNLFWKSKDNSNNYLARLDRFERFCDFVHSLDIKSTYPATTLVNRYRIIGDYYFYIRNYSEALKYYNASVEKEGENNKILQLIDNCRQLLKQGSRPNLKTKSLSINLINLI